MPKNKTTLLVCLILFSLHSFSQQQVYGIIIDAETQKPIPYCGVGLLHSSIGCLSNEEGVFKINARPDDTLLISMLSYQRLKVQVKSILENRVVKLIPFERQIDEVTVLAKSDWAYQLLAKSRKALMKSAVRKSKAYYLLSTEMQGQPIELLECYYTATLDQNRVMDLAFKNGRVGLATYDKVYFVNLDISGAFTLIDILNGNERMPENPYQFPIRELKRHFIVTLEERYDSLHPVQVLRFKAIKPKAGFSGRVHVLVENNLPLKIELDIDSTRIHPFHLLSPDEHILSTSMRITKVFELSHDSLFTHHIDFDYVLNYTVKSEKRKVTSKGLLYFYDYHRPFLPVLYPPNNLSSDYKKISSLSYNEAFWDLNGVFEYSRAVRANRRFLEAKGITLGNSDALKIAPGLEHSNFFEINDLPWSPQKRLSVHDDFISNDTTLYTASGEGQKFLIDNYRFIAAIYLDANPIGDSLQHKSVSVFNVQDSYYNMKTDTLTDCILNIYFDLVEIERRNMEKEITRNPRSWPHIQACYTKASKNIESLGLKYFAEINRGKNRRKLVKWNELVKQETGIDNMTTFKVNSIDEIGDSLRDKNKPIELKVR